MQFGSHEVEEQLGRGGAATVFRARDSQGRQVALKVLDPSSPRLHERFVREARALAAKAYKAGLAISPTAAAGRSFDVHAYIAEHLPTPE